jgi:glycosyltransferase involved in cell wall biosynthesis
VKVSVIIATYNEEKYIGKCIASLLSQSVKHEIIIVDDGSEDKTEELIKQIKLEKIDFLQYFKIKHLGPAAARNFGAEKATGDILVFVDADMVFDSKFLIQLINPIVNKLTKGTFTNKEFVANWDKIYAKCWNYNQGLSNNLRIPENYPNQAPVFRAILASEFKRVNGFIENIGWTDDWSLSKKLGYKSTVTNAICYHNNPQNLMEVFIQSKWIGKNEFISGNFIRSCYHLIKSSLLISLIIGIYKSIKYKILNFIFFKLVFDLGITLGIIQRIFFGSKNK